MKNWINGMTIRVSILSIVMTSIGCKDKTKETPIADNNKEPETIVAVTSPKWSQLFIKNEGWFGGDGIFGIPMDGKEFVAATDSTVTLFTFGDTMIGHHDGQSLQPEDFLMINNSVGILKGKEPNADNITFYWKESEGQQAKALFKPNTPNSRPHDYYWLGDGFVNTEGDENLYVFAYPVREKDTTGIGGFNFEQVGVNLLQIPKNSTPPYLDHTQLETPFFDSATQTSFGSAIYVNTESAGAPDPDGHIYTYAVSNQEGTKGLLVARVLPEYLTKFDHWKFWNGQDWVAEMEEAIMIAKDVSNEMSVSPLSDGRIVLTYQRFTMGPEVAIQIGESLVGPFEEPEIVYLTTENDTHKTYFTYNAKAYPHLSKPGTLLASYNVNSFDFWADILKDPNLYRPRFLEISLE
ncbi:MULTISPECIES: DUF4185 domain-containing protein [Flagellimonas]|jgi:hypothetical protein|uniref:DUF4185 domain-containing protein n=2 Tax=Flagellimonas TaxID=444459 RepID=A0A3A1NPB7_9FLAO|nr:MULTISPECIES: DUF4185 domain-containing protein [Allomuricauda]RIV46108.1 DUF4185 domain-containing protein [Allomuricauda maritima]TXJ98883.1 DUF4185 domain-containing protein [Allomuricauda maritima]SFC59595.1 protein of unknown function [Allomuricauda taeanensis]SHK84802.1 protein of unknown function [Allomuricauda taeanensis]